MKKISNILIGLGLFFVGLSILLYSYYEIDDLVINNKANSSVVDIIYNNITEVTLESEKDNENDNSPLTDNKETEGIEIDSNKYIGILYIKSLNMELPVLNKWVKKSRTAALYYGGVDKSDFVIAGHNLKSVFKGIKSLKVGDEVIFLDLSANLHTYHVQKMEVVHGTETQKVINSGYSLILFTCLDDNNYRMLVYCN